MLRMALLAAIATLGLLGGSSPAAGMSAAATGEVVIVPSDGPAPRSPVSGGNRVIVMASTEAATPGPTPAQESVDPQAPATSEPEPTPPEPTPTEESVDPESPTVPSAVVSNNPLRSSASPQVRDSQIPLGSIALALLVLATIGVASYILVRGRPTATVPRKKPRTPSTGQPARAIDAVADRSVGDPTPANSASLGFLIGLGEALMDAGAAVGHVESALQAVAEANGIEGVGVIVLPTALIVSVPTADHVITEIGAPGQASLRFDQIDDVLSLVREAEAGAIGVSEGARRLVEIRTAPGPHPPSFVLMGHVCATVGLAAILHATWIEVILSALIGAVVGTFRIWTRRLSSSYQPFVVLIAATAVSTTVFGLTRLQDELLTFPLLIAPLITFLPGGLLSIAVLELATGQIVSGSSRLASGGLQLVLLALGVVAGSQLVGVPARELGSNPGGTVAVLTPWIGVAVFGIGLVWFYGARPSARIWILLVMYVAYAGQVIGGLFFGSALSAFFGALAMTPVAVLIGRKPTAPSPFVTVLPGFWLLVPGALGLDGVTRLFGAGGAGAPGVLATTVTSMVGVSLGILLGLLLGAPDPAHPWSETSRTAPPPDGG